MNIYIEEILTPSKHQKNYHCVKHLEKKVSIGKFARPINNTDIIHVEAIAIFTNPENHHPVKLKKKRQGISP
ncbi:MAG: hypothetical protein F6K23_32860 [Okeania sp. SIO2C9]|uniref:hypothetical protein n=1 Tax=Okeania sp. SIO2C9 TaxID=2607791 RepID=UPI0013C27C6A|nr:hypothetical protein [Okeania sp. SIO2C9]NEQ77383.1 hypothetical protein [Okeania sp. SIO2C9]